MTSPIKHAAVLNSTGRSSRSIVGERPQTASPPPRISLICKIRVPRQVRIPPGAAPDCRGISGEHSPGDDKAAGRQSIEGRRSSCQDTKCGQGGFEAAEPDDGAGPVPRHRPRTCRAACRARHGAPFPAASSRSYRQAGSDFPPVQARPFCARMFLASPFGLPEDD